MRILFAVLIFGPMLDGVAFAKTEINKLPWIHHLQIIQSPAYNASSCEATLESLQQTLESMNWEDFSNESLHAGAGFFVQKSWNLRQLLHRKIPQSGKECALKVRTVFHLLRDFEDYASEFIANVAALDPKTLNFQTQKVPILGGPAPFYSLRKNTEPFGFKSGDLMLARGISFVSAIISQVSDNRSHFSHVVTVYITGTDMNKNSTVESYIGSGVAKFDLPFALKNENARLLVLRPKDQALATRAADEAMAAAKLKLPYDYEMNDEDSRAMSCMEVPVYAFRKASGNVLNLPVYPASVALENPQFLTRLGLTKGMIRTPDDLEIDPNFDLIADWQDLRILRDSRYKDAVLSEMLRWISDLKYDFHDNLKSYFVMFVLKPLRSTFLWPWLQERMELPSMDEHVPRNTLGLMVLIDEVAERLLEKLRARDLEHQSVHGRPMTNQQLREVLERYRITDAVSEAEEGISDFHGVLNSDKE